MKILIIGARGMLGQALVAAFADRQVLAWDREEIDITDFDASRQKIVAARPDVIINAAALTDVDACEQQRELADKLNGQAPGHLARVANEIGARLVQFSTSYVFDGTKQEGYREDDEPKPLSYYGLTKLAGERGTATAAKHYILRLDRLFGHSGSGKKSFVDKFIEAASQQRVEMIDDEFGGLTYAPDLAQRTRFVMEKGVPYGVYHATNAGSCSWYEWAREIAKLRGLGVELVPVHAAAYPRQAARPRYATLLNTKLPPMRSWQEALREYLRGQTLSRAHQISTKH